MKLIIAEKPSVAAAYAAALGAANKKDGYFEGNSLLVSWCIGHLVSLAEAGAYDENYKNGDMRICLFCRRRGSMSFRPVRKSSFPFCKA